jgi:hypothetical protein
MVYTVQEISRSGRGGKNPERADDESRRFLPDAAGCGGGKAGMQAGGRVV